MATMSKEFRVVDHLPHDIVAPHGWDLHGCAERYNPPAPPYMLLNGHWYVPRKPQPRVWEGTVLELANETTGDPWEWGDSVVVRVEEVL